MNVAADSVADDTAVEIAADLEGGAIVLSLELTTQSPSPSLLKSDAKPHSSSLATLHN